VDQAAVSAGNFGTGVVLARSVDQSTFAVFVLATTLPFIVLQLQYGLLMNPLTVNGAALQDGDFARLVKANAWLQAAFTLVAGFVLVGVVLVWEPLRPVLLPLLVLSTLWQVQEFCRRVLYARGEIRAALLNNVVNYDVQVVLMLVAVPLGVLNLESALWLAAATSLAASLLGFWQVRGHLLAATPVDLRKAAHESFLLGKWTGATAAIVAIGQQATPLLLAALAGLPSAAVLGVLNQLLGPTNLLGRPLQNYFTPVAIRALSQQRISGLNRVLRHAVLVTLPAYAAYTLVLAIVPGVFLGVVYGTRYIDYANELRLFSLVQLIGFGVPALTVELATRRMQKQVFWGHTLFAALEYSVGALLTVRFGLIGLIWGLGLALVAQIALYASAVIRARVTERRAQPEAALASTP
jgi:O-antigen/teichoic acid export membrane protein